MNGPEHYRAAERLIGRADDMAMDDAMYLLAAAQVHATLALAAATAENCPDGATSARQWQKVTAS